MPSFTPITPPTAGAFTPVSAAVALTDSTYGDLGGTYGTINYVYGGFGRNFTAAGSPGVGVWTPIS